LSVVRVVLTGAAGFIGSHVAEELLREGHSVIGIDALTSNYAPALKRMNMAEVMTAPRFRFEQVDLTDADLHPLLVDADAVMHLAASPGVRHSWGPGFVRYSDANVLALQRLLEAVLDTGIGRFVFASSSSVYGRMSGPIVRNLPGFHPVSPYGVTKLAGELLCGSYQEKASHLDIVALRYFTVYGPRQRPDMALARFIYAALQGGRVTVYGDGSQRRYLTYVEDAARATALAAVRPLSGFQIFDVLGREAWSVNEMLDAVVSLTGREIVVDRVPGRSDDPLEIVGDHDGVGLALGWQPTTSVQRGLRAQIEWSSKLVREDDEVGSLEIDHG
jgi:UDP-glucuronate 4-epimerase